jgi:hypothetical protein
MSDHCPSDESYSDSTNGRDEAEGEEDDAQASSFLTHHRFELKRCENRWRSFKRKSTLVVVERICAILSCPPSWSV